MTFLVPTARFMVGGEQFRGFYKGNFSKFVGWHAEGSGFPLRQSWNHPVTIVISSILKLLLNFIFCVVCELQIVGGRFRAEGVHVLGHWAAEGVRRAGTDRLRLQLQPPLTGEPLARIHGLVFNIGLAAFLWLGPPPLGDSESAPRSKYEATLLALELLASTFSNGKFQRKHSLLLFRGVNTHVYQPTHLLIHCLPHLAYH